MAILVGLTGGIGAGKSTALGEFSRLGAKTVSLDVISRDVVRPRTLGFRRVVARFGRGILSADGAIDRTKLAREVFASPASRRLLERITHPLILREMNRRVAAAGRARPVVVDVPLLFEKKLASRFDVTMLVTAGRGTRLTRAAGRDGVSLSQIRRRLAAQMPQKAKEALADVVLANDGSRRELRAQVRRYYRSFQLISAHPSQGGA